ncbi:hypothetical protein V6I34_RS26175, partial [Escherichia coli]
MKNHPVKIFYESLTSIVAPCMTKPQHVQEICTCCGRPAREFPVCNRPAGNRLPDPELHPDSTLTAWPDNRIAEDAHYVYRYDEYGRLAEKTDR